MLFVKLFLSRKVVINMRKTKIVCTLGPATDREGVLRDAVRDGGGYADYILMAILEDEWREIKKSEEGRLKSED